MPDGWRRGVQADLIERELHEDRHHTVRAVCVGHNKISTSVTSDILNVRRAIGAVEQPALRLVDTILVDTISGRGSADHKPDDGAVDVRISGPQKRWILSPGISFNMSLGTGLGKFKGRMFRIGHLGECNDLSLLAALSGCEMGMQNEASHERGFAPGKRSSGGRGVPYCERNVSRDEREPDR